MIGKRWKVVNANRISLLSTACVCFLLIVGITFLWPAQSLAQSGAGQPKTLKIVTF